MVKVKILENKLTKVLNIRTQKDYPKKGIEFIDIMPLIIEKEIFNEIIDKFVKEIKEKVWTQGYLCLEAPLLSQEKWTKVQK